MAGGGEGGDHPPLTGWRVYLNTYTIKGRRNVSVCGHAHHLKWLVLSIVCVLFIFVCELWLK